MLMPPQVPVSSSTLPSPRDVRERRLNFGGTPVDLRNRRSAGTREFTNLRQRDSTTVRFRLCNGDVIPPQPRW
jgi:hypothetical protein